MRHRNNSKRLGRKPDQARQLLKNLATSVLLYERVRTTKKRAEVVRGVIDRIITIGKTDRTDLAIRKLTVMVTDKNASKKVLEVYKKRYADRPSGFTRMKPVGMRKGDGALLVDLELVDAAIEGDTAEEAVAAPKKKSPRKKVTA
ncbi:MAG: 50S ribosomal protein L17 [Candidatus Peribacteraceae bacterium]